MTTVSVTPSVKVPSHHLSLTDGTNTYGLILPDGVKNVQEYPYSPSSLQFQEGRSGYGSFEPPYTSIDQIDWSGGRGQLKFADSSKFYDSYNAWTMTEGLLMPAPLWRFASGFRTANSWMPGDILGAGNTQNTALEWVTLTGSQAYVAVKFTTGSAYSAKNLVVFARYFGTGGTSLTAHIYNDSSGSPSTSQGNAALSAVSTIDPSPMPEGAMVGQLLYFNLTTAISLSASTDYWLVLVAVGGGATNYWQVATGNNGTLPTYKESSDGSTWNTNATRGMYYRVTGADVAGKVHYIEYKRALYACSEPNDGSAGRIYLNGDRGMVIASGLSGLEAKTFDYSPGGATGTWLTPVQRWTAYENTVNTMTQAQYKLTTGLTLTSGAVEVKVHVEDARDSAGNADIDQLKLMIPNTGAYTPRLTGDTSGSTNVASGTTVTLTGTGSETYASPGYFAIEFGWSYPWQLTARITEITWIEGGVTRTTLWKEGGVSTLTDTTKSWTVNEWAGAYCHIWNGTGEGQWRKIASNTATVLTVSPDWDIPPAAGGTDVGSEFVIVGTPSWKDVTPQALGGGAGIHAPITDALTLWGVLYLAQGEVDNILRVREYNNSGAWKVFWTTSADTNTAAYDGTNKALFLQKTYDPVNENYIWRIRNMNPAEFATVDNQTSASKANDVAWGTSLTFGSSIPIGTIDYLISGIAVYNNKLWVGKEDSVWYIDSDGTYDRAYPLQVGLEAITSPTNCIAMAAKDLYLYFNWAHSVERLYSGTLDDIGPWRDSGMIRRAQGHVSNLIPAIGWMFASIDGGTQKQSSLMGFKNGWHTLFRAPVVYQDAFSGDLRARHISGGGGFAKGAFWQSVHGEDASNWLWFNCGGDIMFMQMPRSALNPSLDNDLMFAPESYVVQSRMDAGFTELEKYWDKARIVSPALDGTVYVDYATNPTLHEPAFTNAGSGTSTPSFNVSLSQSRKRDLMLRTRISAADFGDTTENTIEGIVVDGLARKPVKYNWQLVVRLRDQARTLTGLPDHDPDTLYTQLKDWASQAQALTMRSVLTQMDNKSVFIEPPSALRDFWNRVTSWWGGRITVVLREA